MAKFLVTVAFSLEALVDLDTGEEFEAEQRTYFTTAGQSA